MKSHCALSLVFFVGCTLGPDYERPPLDVPGLVPELAAVSTGDSVVRITTAEPVDRWWALFGDPQLERLVDEARHGNQDLHAALARVHAARAVVREAFAPLFPTIGATAQYDYTRFAPNSIPFNPQAGQVVSPGQAAQGASSGVPTFAFSGTPFQLWAGTADMSYELDLWGRVRRGYEAARAQEAATEEDRRSLEITVASEVAEAYFDLGQADADLEIAQEDAKLRESTLALVQERFSGGLVPELDVRRSRTELAASRAQVPEQERRRSVAEHRLSVLLGHMPVLHFVGRVPAEFDVPPELPVGLPGSLLERRPDVRAAELRLRAANARIGEAVAGYLPEVTIFGRFGYASIDVWKLANPSSQLFAAGPSIRLPIFEGGKTYAQVLEAEANTDEATASYVKTVQNAFREVADAIVGIRAQERIRDEETVAVAESQEAVRLVTELYEKGLTNYLNVLDAQRALLAARQALVQAQRSLLSDMVQLEKALGGGWASD
jgi:NodT family efflux transporter outer membrane factor (OMF) lipoprotein